MKPEPVLIDLKKLRELISKLDLDEKRKQYIDARWLNYIEWWDSRANRAKWRYYGLRTAVVIGGALIPALVGLRELKVWPDGYDYSWLFAVASIVASLIVAICAGLESTFGFGDIWREKRNAAEIIKSEGLLLHSVVWTLPRLQESPRRVRALLGERRTAHPHRNQRIRSRR